jgi:hypothetical protein
MRVKQEKKEGAKEGKKVPMADTNVVALSLGVLAQEPALMTGEAVFCEECKAALSTLSTLQTADNAGKLYFLLLLSICILFICILFIFLIILIIYLFIHSICLLIKCGSGDEDAEAGQKWQCEFCGHVNEDLHLEEEEIPTANTVDYMLAPPSLVEDGEGESTTAAAAAANLTFAFITMTPSMSSDSSRRAFGIAVTSGLIVFCMDISGSMCVSTEVPALQNEWKALRQGGGKVTARTRTHHRTRTHM